MAQPGLHSMAMAISTKEKKRGSKRKRKKSTMAGGACATLPVFKICEWELQVFLMLHRVGIHFEVVEK